MRKLAVLAALLSAAAVPNAAPAQVFVGVRAGYALPWGDVMTSSPVKDSFKSQIPLTLDLGLKLGPALAVGAYASYAVVQPSSSWRSDCDATGSSCSAADIRLGVQVNLHASNTETTELWGGVAVGYEQLRAKDSLGLFPEMTFKGYDATLQGGVDFLTSPSFRIGPFASVTVGQFNKVKATSEADITNKELHGWIQLGLRGMFAN
jgi:hypothetical protein